MHEVIRPQPAAARPLRRVLSPLLVLPAALAVAACGGDSGRERAAGAREALPRPVADAELEAEAAEKPRAVAVLSIFSEIRQDSLTRGRDISVSAPGTSFILIKGRVPSEAVHRRALEIARPHVRGLTLLDSLEVDPAAPDAAARGGA